MKDALLLLGTGAGLSVAAWAFWRYFGSDGFGILNMAFVVYISVDNFRLRRRLRDTKTKG